MPKFLKLAAINPFPPVSASAAALPESARCGRGPESL